MPVNAFMEAVLGDITQLNVDAIVNAANTTLLGGGGVDGAIHRVAGPELLAYCRSLSDSNLRCSTGQAVITPGFRLKARYVIHTVGPLWHGGDQGEPELLASCYWKSLQLAVEKQVKSIAFPGISTGVFGYPADTAAKIAIETVHLFLKRTEFPLHVVFVCFSAEALAIYRRFLND